MVFITSYEVAEQISRASKLFPTSIPKVDLKYLEHVIGSTSILWAHGNEWKALRKTFNHGFSSQHLMTLLPTMLAQISTFTNHLDSLSKSGEVFSLVSLTMDLTFDIIGAVIFDNDLGAQHLEQSHQGKVVRSFKELLSAYWDDKIYLPWWLSPQTELRRQRLGKQLDEDLKSMIRQKHEELQARRDKDHDQSRSILSLILGDTKTLSQGLLDLTCDQLKTFLLAGHDTPSATLAWVFYELSRCPRALSAVRTELDDILGPGTDPESISTLLSSAAGPDLVGRMTYIIAVIKETLRLHTPASTARYSAPGNALTIRTPTGQELGLDDVIIYNCSSIIHRDPAVYGDTGDHFVPERWLGDPQNTPEGGGTAHNPHHVPCGSWRPFERGPRACIGQEFATIELRVIIAVIARRYDFIKVGLGELAMTEGGRPILGHDGQYKVKSHVYNVGLRLIPSLPCWNSTVMLNNSLTDTTDNRQACGRYYGKGPGNWWRRVGITWS